MMRGFKSKKYFREMIVIITILIFWYVATASGNLNTYVLPSPGKVMRTMVGMTVSGEIFTDICISMWRVLQGFSIAFVLAFSIAALKISLPKSSLYYEFILDFFRNVPPLAMIPLLILWFGIGETTKIIIIVLAAFFPMYLNIVNGFTSCDRKLLEVGEVFGYNKREKFQKIIFPHAFADILVGMRIGMGYSWRAIIGAEMVAASTGLGHMILFSQQMSRTDKVIVGILMIGVVGIITDKIFANIIKKFLKGTGHDGWNQTQKY